MSAAPIATVIDRLKKAYPKPAYELRFDNPLQLLVGAILAAQCTDERVNSVTPKLFGRFPVARSFADGDLAEIEDICRSIPFTRKKSEAIQESCKIIVRDHGGEVPREMDELLKLPRVARKTANLVLTLAYGVPSGIVVDTHVARVAQRLGLTAHDKGEKIEEDLLAAVPKKEWVTFGPRLTLLGRQVCTAKKPNCPGCPMDDICPKVGVS